MSTLTTDQSLSALQDDLAALKRDMGSLLAHLKSGVAAEASTATESIEAGAARLYRGATAEGCKSAKALARQVEEQPVLAMLVLLGLGYLGGRLLAR